MAGRKRSAPQNQLGLFLAPPEAERPHYQGEVTAKAKPRTRGLVFSANPCVELYGEAEGVYRCGGCIHLEYVGRDHYICHMRAVLPGEDDNHRLLWPACAHFMLFTPRY